MLILAGAPVGSAFRGARQLERLRTIDSALIAVHARYLYFIDCPTLPDAAQRVRLEALLGLEARATPFDPQHSVLVVPRPGT